jgi:hypothetical protein
LGSALITPDLLSLADPASCQPARGIRLAGWDLLVYTLGFSQRISPLLIADHTQNTSFISQPFSSRRYIIAGSTLLPILTVHSLTLGLNIPTQNAISPKRGRRKQLMGSNKKSVACAVAKNSLAPVNSHHEKKELGDATAIISGSRPDSHLRPAATADSP